MHRHRRQPRSRTSGTLRASSRRRALAALGLLLLAASPSFAKHETVRYRLTVDVTWSPETHPGACPPNAHLSWLAGGTHDASVSFWQEGKLASPGLVQMAETGVTLLLEDEVAQAIAAAGAGSVLAWHHWFCPLQTSSTSCGLPVVELDVGIAHPLVTLVSMLGPTPDWFVGVSGLPLRDERGWIDTVVVDLRPYDGGTRDANAFELFGPLTLPPEPITLITERSGQLIGPGSLGTLTFELLENDPCPDTNGDGVVDVDDLTGVLLDWDGDGAEHGTDLDGSGTVDIDDLLLVLLGWGPCRKG